MSLDSARRASVSSPPTSGRSSPVPRATRRTVEGDLFKADKGLRRYAANIERALSTWETAPEEWADYIAFLARLLKAIQTHPKDSPLLPHSKDISTRLAQCLDPELPSGVHSKSLEVYSYIFSAFGNGYVSAHLHEFLPGLAAVLSFASLSVRPALYELFEEHVVQLPRTELRPALRAVILGLLPALEEGQGDEFERAFGILNTLQRQFTPQQEDSVSSDAPDGYFWQCLFLAVITSPLRRQGALNYMLRALPKFPGRTSDQHIVDRDISRQIDCVVSPEPGLLVRCFISGLSDEQILVQRGFLDLLVSNIPLDSMVLQTKLGADDLDRLVAAASSVILRKDMSLNRRLWSWFLGPEPKDQVSESHSSLPAFGKKSANESGNGAQLKYFSNYGHKSLERCAHKMLKGNDQAASSQARPFRIFSSLMDRWEIGGLLVEKIFLPAMESLFEYSQSRKPTEVSEVVRSASTFFDGVEASLIWERLLSTLRDALEHGRTPERNLQLFVWILDTFNVRDEEMTSVHIPLTQLYLATHLDSGVLSTDVKVQVLSIMSTLLELIPARVLRAQSDADRADQKAGFDDKKSPEEWRTQVRTFYTLADHAGNRLPCSLKTIVGVITGRVISLSAAALSGRQSVLFQKAVALRVSLLEKTAIYEPDHDALTYRTLADTYLVNAHSGNIISFPILSNTIALLAGLNAAQSDVKNDTQRIVALEPALVAQLWTYLSPSLPKYHVEAVRAVWQLVGILGEQSTVQASILAHVKSAHELEDTEGYRRFTVLWTHSIVPSQSKAKLGRRVSAFNTLSDPRVSPQALVILEEPLLLALDALENNPSTATQAVKSWVQRSTNLDQVFGILFRRLNEISASKPLDPSPRGRERALNYQIKKMHHTLGYFENILRIANNWIWDRLAVVMLPRPVDGTELGGIASLTKSCIQWLESDLPLPLPFRRRLVSLIYMAIDGPGLSQLSDLNLPARLLVCLTTCISGEASELQGDLLRLVTHALDRQPAQTIHEQTPDHRSPSNADTKRPSTTSTSRPANRSSISLASSLPNQLFKCIRLGLSTPQARDHLDGWLELFAYVLPKYADVVLTNLIPLVETFCDELSTAHRQLASLASTAAPLKTIAPDHVAVSLLDGLEILLDRAYECLLSEADDEPTPKEPEARSNFFSNVASGVFRSDSPASRTATTNSRLTVILAFQDAIRVSMNLWLWANNVAETSQFDTTNAATTGYSALKVRNKTRHTLEQIFSLEPLESLEVIIAHWWACSGDSEAASTLSLLHVLQITRPKSVIPAILDSLCTRTNPSAIPSARHSSLTLDLEPAEVATFFSAYLDSIEDDAIDEVWADCLAFVRDVLANPLPYRQALSQLLSIVLLLAEKLSNTNFGEQRKMRRDLGDSFQRLLTATFTTLPSGYVSEPAEAADQEAHAVARRERIAKSMFLMPVLERITSSLDLIIDTPERVAATVNNICQALVAPILRAKSFPTNVTPNLLSVLVHMSRKAPGSKAWKKEVHDAFNDPKFLTSSPNIMESGWFAILQQWSLHDKERMLELLSRLTPPSSAGIMFGVGASAARTEADRRTQLNLRRISILLLALPKGTYNAHTGAIEEKLAELFGASLASSPSATIKAELFLLCRAAVLSLSSSKLSPLWPIINDNMQDVITSLYPGAPNQDQFNNLTLLQACRLLDLLIALSPDEFQLHEWLYITDTIDAVYRPHDWTPAALTDQIAEALGTSSLEDSLEIGPSPDVGNRRRPLLSDELAGDKEDVKAMARDEFVRSVIRPFLSQLSIHAYEGVYSLDAPDIPALRRSVLVDVLDLGSVVE